MFHAVKLPGHTSGLDAFNEVVRNKLGTQMLENLEQQRALIPYRFVAIGSMPFVGFFFFGVSWFRDASLYTQVGGGGSGLGAWNRTRAYIFFHFLKFYVSFLKF